MRRTLLLLLPILTLAPLHADIVRAPDAAPRVLYGVDHLQRALDAAHLDRTRIVVGTTADADVKALESSHQLALTKGEPRADEGFVIQGCADGSLAIVGSDDSGVLYGCLELAKRLAAGERPGPGFHFADAPAFELRGPCIGMQKTYILPGRKVYEYPYTPQLFPFFYDKSFWRGYLDYLVSLRMNTLYLWAGQPFGSLVRVKEYPEAVEVPPDVFKRNVEMYRWITRECDRRGIWLVQEFYSILLPKPFAEKYGMSTQLSAPNPRAADYTRKAIAEFVHQYPNVGLLVCLGEALRGQENQTHWFTNVILPGVKDGMAEAGLKNEPPVILRTHATDARLVVPPALKEYHNLYTMSKYNGESLTTWDPRGERQKLDLAMSRIGTPHISNVHILANLEPFRYGDQQFIQKCVQAMRDRLGAKGVHVYPLFYWNWPYSPDIAHPKLLQWKRDWIWFEAWARYAWDPDIPAKADHAYWIGRIADHYGEAAAADILGAYNNSGECAPRILRRFGITDGNRQTMSLGMTLDELVNPRKYHPFPLLWTAEAPPGERLQEYVQREWGHKPHVGETPPQVIREIEDFSARAVREIDAAEPLVTKNRAEFERLRNDIHCIREMSLNYATKAQAALCVLRYKYSHDIKDMVRAEGYLHESLEHYRKLVDLTKDTYSAANSMQTSQRRIPVPGGRGGKPANYLWSQLLPLYQREYVNFKAQVDALRTPGAHVRTHAPLPAADFKILTPGLYSYTIQVGNTVFTDSKATFTEVAPELEGLQGIKFSFEAARDNRLPPITWESKTPVKVLIGFFDDDGRKWRRPPTLETDATAAAHGGAEAFLLDGVKFDSLPPADVYEFTYPAGRQTLDLHGSGAYVILGFAR